MYYIVSPQKQYIGPRQVAILYENAKADGKLAKDDRNWVGPNQQILALHQAGIVTLGQPAPSAYKGPRKHAMVP